MTDELTEAVDPLPEEKGVRSTISELLEDGTIPIVAGGLILFAALRSLGRGRARSLSLAAVGTVLIGIGARKRQSTRESEEYEPWTIADEETAEGPKETSDDAHAAQQRHAHGREDDIGDVAADEDEELETPTDLGDDEKDPRLDGDDEVDLSEAARADEPSEATGPDPEQAQPAQTEATEPESEPDEESTADDESEEE
ncbi:hypothetical protein ACYJ1Y_15480 [Natrialbaceae archaeon A-gly3]